MILPVGELWTMDHHLVPEFILHQVEHERFAGKFHAPCLFVDLSGFTALTTALMEYGTEGAEVIAEILSALFEPLIEIVYRQKGFVAAFAGDAFKAIFPTTTPDAYLRTITTAWQMHQTMAKQSSQSTRFGVFHFAIKISIADGLVEWGVWQADPMLELLANRQRAAYFFAGEAIKRCLEVDAANEPNTVVMTQAIYARLPHDLIMVEQYTSYFKLTNVADELINRFSNRGLPQRQQKDGIEAMFFPLELLQQQTIGEFRQVATLFIDLQLVPSSAEAQVFAQILFQLLVQYGGYFDLIGQRSYQNTGCTLLLFWGAPISHENNLRRALDFLLALRDAAFFPLRASVTMNLVYAGFVGSPLHQEYTCYGVYVNLAARQLAVARWGEILLDEKSARQINTAFNVDVHGWHTLKGFSQPQLVYSLSSQRRATIQPLYHTLMVGRQKELHELWQAIQPLFEGKFGGIISISGEAGIGKSRLVYEFQSRTQSAEGIDSWESMSSATAAAQAVTWFFCPTDEILREPLNPFRSLLRTYFHQSATNSESLNKQHFTAQLEELIANIPDKPLAEELKRTASFLGALVGLYWSKSLYESLEPQLRFDNTLAALKTFFKAQSLRQPLIIHTEDAHWLDAESARLLAMLTYNVDNFPFLLLLTIRPPTTEQQNGSAEDKIRALLSISRTRLHLTSLKRNDLHKLATYWLRGNAPANLVDLLVERAGGNPFFAEQILHYLQEQALITWSDKGWQLIQTSKAFFTADIPALSATIHMILTARLDQLPPTVKGVVQTAAVLGQTFDLSVLEHMLQHDSALRDHISVAERANIWSVGEMRKYFFRHALLWATAYNMQLRAQLRTLHRQAAEAIQQVYANELAAHYAELVHHYHLGEDEINERDWAKLAGVYAAERYENEKAIFYISRALALTNADELSEHYALLLQREAIYNLLGQRQAQAEDLQTLRVLAETMQDRFALAEIRLRQAYYWRVIGDYQAALTVIQEMVEQASVNQVTTLEDNRIAARVYHAWGRILLRQGNVQDALPKLAHALALSKATGNRLDQADSLYDIGYVHSARREYGLATANYLQAITLYRELGNQRGEINCSLMFGVIANEQGDYLVAHQHYQQAISRCREIGWRHARTYCLTNLGNNYFDIGDYAAAFTSHQSALEICRDIGDREGEAISLDTLGLIWQNLHNGATARIHFEQALAIQRQIGDRHGEGFTLTHLGHTLYALEELETAKECFQGAYELRMALNEASHLIDDLAGLALCELTANHLQAAVAAVERCLTWIQTHGVDGIEFPILVYLIAYRVLRATAQAGLTPHERAHTILEEGYKLLQLRAAKIQDLTLRRQFLDNVSFNRELRGIWIQANSQA